MNVQFSDSQRIGELTAQAFQIYQQGPVDTLLTLENTGVNSIVYSLQQFTSGTWADIGLLGTVFNDTLDAGAVVSMQVDVDSNQVRLMANASGSSTLSFNALQWATRQAGGALPILNF